MIAASVEPAQWKGKAVALRGGLAHDVSIVLGVGRHLGSHPDANTSITIMRVPQRGHGQGSTRGASGAISECCCGSAAGGATSRNAPVLLMESSILSEVHNTSILRTGLVAPSLSLSACYRPLGSRPRAAGWSAATSCSCAFETFEATSQIDVKADVRVSADRDFRLFSLPDNRMKPLAYPFTLGPTPVLRK